MRINHCYLAVLLLAAGSANAALQRLDDANMDKVSGAEGIGIVLDDIQVIAKDNATLNVSFDADTIELYGNKFKIFKYKPKANTTDDYQAMPDAISAGQGFDIGSSADPIKIDIMSVNELPALISGRKHLAYYKKAPKGGFAGVHPVGTAQDHVDIRFLRLALPSDNVSRSDTNSNLRTAHLADNNAHLALPQDTYAFNEHSALKINADGIAAAELANNNKNYKVELSPNQRMQWTTVPFNCSGAAPRCLSLAIRLRADIFRPKYATSNKGELQERLILWTRADGVSLDGSYVDVWADQLTGMSLSANVAAYVNELQLTTRTNSQTNTEYPTVNVKPEAVNQGETATTVRQTLPYADKDTAKFKDDGADTGLKLSGVYADLHLGNKFYQPLRVRSELTAVDRQEPAAVGTMRPDKMRSDLSLELAEIPNEPEIYNEFYRNHHNKSNIHVREIKMGAGTRGLNAANPNNGGYSQQGSGYNFGSLTVEGLRIQKLKFTTRELKPLTANHCPSGWSCSFR